MTREGGRRGPPSLWNMNSVAVFVADLPMTAGVILSPQSSRSLSEKTPRNVIDALRAPALPAQPGFGGRFGRGAEPPSEFPSPILPELALSHAGRGRRLTFRQCFAKNARAAASSGRSVSAWLPSSTTFA